MTVAARLCLLVLLTPLSAAAAEAGRGRLIALGGAGESVATACFRCHGLDGGGDAALAAPRLAGLSAFYLAKQMRDFARGSRPDAVMSPIARALDAGGVLAVAAYYAALPPPPAAAAEPPAQVAAVGRRIARAGAAGRNLPACGDCHGPGGVSKAPAIPTLAGQPAGYLAAQLRRWRAGDRRNDPLAGMDRFARLLEEDELEAVALWYAAQPPGGDR